MPVLIIAGALFAGVAFAQAPVTPAQQDLPPLDELRATRERPLFVPARRRPDAPVEVTGPEPVVEDKSIPFQLTGIVRGQDFHVAILKQNGQVEEVRVRANEKLAGWTLEEIGDRYVILGGRGKRVRVWLFDETRNTGITVNNGTAAAPGAPLPKRSDVDIDIIPGEQPTMQSSQPLQPAQPSTPPAVRPLMQPGLRPPGTKPLVAPGLRPN